MLSLKLTIMMSILLTSMVMYLALMMSKKKNNYQEKSSTFECGFDPFKSARQPFSLHFFLITLIFLIFDAEIALILPFIPSFNILMNNWTLIFTMFFLILLMGTYYEWMQGMLNWK
uniref:NADH-ubiquinone oxidoreductase chain 3 n=1 Tax=Aposthonia borneensis TaxID=1208762 RepID=A0A343CXL7_9NEOP|nr:NADH dehydrogenase subunit 3 [Aposthonia borneensis]